MHRVDPPNWFTGMDHTVLQLLLIGEELTQVTAEVDYPGLTVKVFDSLPNDPNYALLYLEVTDQAQPGEFTIIIKGKRKTKVKYELQRRSVYEPKGIATEDVIYQLWVDGFVNGDSTNDIASTLGGDLIGVKDHLNDLVSAGFTGFIMSPVNATYDSLHQPQIQDYYSIEPHYGSVRRLIDLQEYAHRKQIKSVRYEYLNSVHKDHPFVQNPPVKTWINLPGAGHYDSTGYLETNHYEATLFDPHASFIDRDQFITGWQATALADLNHANDTVADYLIQQSIWWQEKAPYDAFLLANYADIDQIFLRIWRDRMLQEFPTLMVIGEVQAKSAAAQAWFLGESGLNKEYSSHLESVTDHAVQVAIQDFVIRGDAEAIYHTMSTDFLYPDVNQLLIPLDNWELERWSSLVDEDINKFNMGIGLWATLRGIPMMSYGTEIGFNENTLMRERKPSDTLSAFQSEAKLYVSKLLQWRRKNEPIKEGRFIQFTPQHGVYAYVRDTERQAVLVVVNPSDEVKTVSTRRFTEVTNGYQTATEVISGKSYSIFDTWELQPWETRILELQRNPNLFEE